MFEPLRPTDGTEDESAPVWVIVAYGQFQQSARAITSPTPGILTTAWVAVIEGGDGASSGGYSNQRYDLQRLGTPHELSPAVLNAD